MLCGLRLVSIVVKLFVFFSIGLEVVCKLMFILLVIMLVSVVLFNFGGLKINKWLRVLLCSFVVLMKIFICEWICGWLIYFFSNLGWMVWFVIFFGKVVLVEIRWFVLIIFYFIMWCVGFCELKFYCWC